jgi:hypothetical protein
VLKLAMFCCFLLKFYIYCVCVCVAQKECGLYFFRVIKQINRNNYYKKNERNKIYNTIAEFVCHFHSTVLSCFGKFDFTESDVTVIELSEVVK